MSAPAYPLWEYRVEDFGGVIKSEPKREVFQSLLNAWGEEGWEVVAYRMIENTNQGQIIAKRPLDRTARRWRTMP